MKIEFEHGGIIVHNSLLHDIVHGINTVFSAHSGIFHLCLYPYLGYSSGLLDPSLDLKLFDARLKTISLGIVCFCAVVLAMDNDRPFIKFAKQVQMTITPYDYKDDEYKVDTMSYKSINSNAFFTLGLLGLGLFTRLRLR